METKHTPTPQFEARLCGAERMQAMTTPYVRAARRKARRDMIITVLFTVGPALLVIAFFALALGRYTAESRGALCPQSTEFSTPSSR